MGSIIDWFKSVFGLSLSIAKVDFKLKNEGTWLGILWYLLSPILTFLLLLGIFLNRLGHSIPSYPLYLFLGIILFNYFQKIADSSVMIIRGNSGIIKSINFPKESLLGSCVLKILFSHVFEVLILILFLIFFGISVGNMVFYPMVLIFLSIFAFGVSLILASLGTHFFDLGYIWGFGIRLVWFATPIFYAIEGQTRLFILNLFNPMFYFITIAREIIIYNKIPEFWLIGMAITFSLLFFFIGLFTFYKLKPRFPELI